MTFFKCQDKITPILSLEVLDWFVLFAGEGTTDRLASTVDPTLIRGLATP